MAKLIFTHPQDHPRETYFATSGSLIVGRIDCISAGPASDEQWMWGMQLDIGATPFRRGATVGSLKEASAALAIAWSDWKLWAGLQDIEVAEAVAPAVEATPSLVGLPQF
ncbi:hypothetical protein ASG40_18190 [Methylobacterium sp. Leaf399]|uniref:hypothetical protein n=1 Tax=Methylobacterium sp. Leaf399 TaxID=1736364 RepID=UPI0006F556E3|nr:hypothetical protein [Methylobacterium sp. Leaf399]KQT16170.1 hypothetical protein ASG40_18190 [Methylobacterium sp. Leaf399]